MGTAINQLNGVRDADKTAALVEAALKNPNDLHGAISALRSEFRHPDEDVRTTVLGQTLRLAQAYPDNQIAADALILATENNPFQVTTLAVAILDVKPSSILFTTAAGKLAQVVSTRNQTSDQQQEIGLADAVTNGRPRSDEYTNNARNLARLVLPPTPTH